MTATSLSDRPLAYCGVSGITTPEQARAILDMWPAGAPPKSLMLGILTSQKVTSGGTRNARSPAPEDFARIFQADRRALGLVHYFTKDTDDLGEQLLLAAAPGGVCCHGVQVNVAWPPPEQLKHFQMYGDYERVVLQVGPAALRDTMNPARTVGALHAYNGLITDVLLDVSGGRGKPIDPLFAMGTVDMIRGAFPDLGVGLAGGLSAETLPDVAALVVEYGLSIDAEGRLRNDVDEFDLDKVRAYLGAAAAMWGWV